MAGSSGDGAHGGYSSCDTEWTDTEPSICSEEENNYLADVGEPHQHLLALGSWRPRNRLCALADSADAASTPACRLRRCRWCAVIAAGLMVTAVVIAAAVTPPVLGADGSVHRLVWPSGYDEIARQALRFRTSPGPASTATLLDGHVPAAAWGKIRQPKGDAFPLPSFAQRRSMFPEPNFGRCAPFTIANGRVYGALVPSKSDHVGQVVPGRVFVRCNAHFELRRHFNPERRCVRLADEWHVWDPDDTWFFDSTLLSDICKRAEPAALTATATFEDNAHLRCFETLVRSHPEAGKPPTTANDNTMDVSTSSPDESSSPATVLPDLRSQALRCLGCSSGSLDARQYDCHSDERLFELEDVHCSRQEQLGSLHPSIYCMTPSIVDATEERPCIIVAIGVGFIWEVEQDLATRFNCTVLMFDPTPGSGLGVRSRDRVPGSYRNQFDQSMLHRPYGVWMERVGVSTFGGLAPMQNSKQFGNSKQQELSFVTIRTALERVGVQDGRAVSMLKLDVEGYEFAVLEQILEQRFEYINIDFHTWNHVELSSALHAFADAGYRILGISDARLDNRAAYGTLVHMEFVLLRDPTVIHWQERVWNSIAALGARNCVLMCAPIAVYETTRRSRWRNHRRRHE